MAKELLLGMLTDCSRDNGTMVSICTEEFSIISMGASSDNQTRFVFCSKQVLEGRLLCETHLVVYVYVKGIIM